MRASSASFCTSCSRAGAFPASSCRSSSRSACALITWFGRDGYRDADGSGLSLLDAFSYSTVSVSTTGNGDITPVSPRARTVTALIVTPLRIVFLIVLFAPHGLLGARQWLRARPPAKARS